MYARNISALVSSPHYIWLRSLLMFACVTIFALWQNWQASDIAWSMWISSLVGGGVLIITSIIFNKAFAGGSITPEAIARMTGSKIPSQDLKALPENTKTLNIPRPISMGMGVFFLGFFFVHFGGFHWGHSIFLQSFFPLQGIEPTQSMATIISQCLILYWPFVIASLIDHADDIYKNICGRGSLAMHEPYKTVIKNHILILLLGFLTAFSMDGYTLYILLVFYFFPWGLFKDIFSRKKTAF